MEPRRLGDRPLGVEGERRVDLERDVPVLALARVPDRAEQVTRVLNDLDREAEEELLGITLLVELAPELLGPQTVNTMPEETIDAFQDHGNVELTLTQGLEEANEVLRRFDEAGIDYDDVTATLEREGVDKFSESFAELLDGIRAKSGELVAT